jgi:hypothetical protein
METELRKEVGKYRLLFFQPEPEDGERVCVGVLFEEDRARSYSVLYDDKFPKVRCIAPHYEPELIKFYLDDLGSALRNDSGDDLTLTLRRYGPQLIASEERFVSLPLTDATKLRLLERFVSPGIKSAGEAMQMAAETHKSDQFAEHIRLLVSKYILLTETSFLRNASPQQMFGYASTELGPVAIAIRRPGKTILIDGVDMRLLNRTQVIARSNKVAYKFWQYGRFRSSDSSLLQTPFSRIGVVLDGSIRRTPPYLVAHDYALHQFKKEADIAVDTMSGEGTLELEAMLSSTN